MDLSHKKKFWKKIPNKFLDTNNIILKEINERITDRSTLVILFNNNIIYITLQLKNLPKILFNT